MADTRQQDGLDDGDDEEPEVFGMRRLDLPRRSFLKDRPQCINQVSQLRLRHLLVTQP